MASHQSPSGSKRPRLSLQTKTSWAPSLSTVDPTSFNTLSNASVAAVERSSAIMSEPITAINTLQAFTLATPADHKSAKSRIATPGMVSLPQTPLTAYPASPAQLLYPVPSTMTATPPLSAGSPDASAPAVFAFSSAPFSSSQARARVASSPVDDSVPRRMPALPLCTELGSSLPYSHPRSLHSILRNSPLPPTTAIPAPSRRRQSLRLKAKATKKVGYNSPLTQEIVTNMYTKSHIELIGDDGSPGSPYSPAGSDQAPNAPLAFTANEVRDGGQTPSPFGDYHGTPVPSKTGASSPSQDGRRKRKRKHQWVWTIGQDDDDDDEALDEATTARPAEADNSSLGPAPAVATDMPGDGYLETPTPSVESAGSVVDPVDAGTSGVGSVDSSEDGLSEPGDPSELGLDPKTPVAPSQPGERQFRPRDRQRDTPIPELSGKRDIAVPPELT